MICLLAATRCRGEIRDCDAMLPVGWSALEPGRMCEEYPGHGLAVACWRFAMEEAFIAKMDGRYAPDLWAVRSAARGVRDALAHASTATWLHEQGTRRCSASEANP